MWLLAVTYTCDQKKKTAPFVAGGQALPASILDALFYRIGFDPVAAVLWMQVSNRLLTCLLP